jgi:chromosome segregation ATPase
MNMQPRAAHLTHDKLQRSQLVEALQRQEQLLAEARLEIAKASAAIDQQQQELKAQADRIGLLTQFKNEFATSLDREIKRAAELSGDLRDARRETDRLRGERDRALGYIDRILEDDAVRERANGEKLVAQSMPEIERLRRGPRQRDEIPF